MAYPGKEPDYEAQERVTLRGPMVPLFNEDGAMIDSGLVEQALYFVRRNTRMDVRLEGGRRVERRAYPEEALREVIVNDLVHRDYLFTGINIQLSLYSDRLEVVSPGSLPNGITPMRMRVGARALRNQMVKEVMRDYKYIEHMGMGVPRKIVDGMKKHNGSDPDLIEQAERFMVRLLAGRVLTETRYKRRYRIKSNRK